MTRMNTEEASQLQEEEGCHLFCRYRFAKKLSWKPSMEGEEETIQDCDPLVVL